MFNATGSSSSTPATLLLVLYVDRPPMVVVSVLNADVNDVSDCTRLSASVATVSWTRAGADADQVQAHAGDDVGDRVGAAGDQQRLGRTRPTRRCCRRRTRPRPGRPPASWSPARSCRRRTRRPPAVPELADVSDSRAGAVADPSLMTVALTPAAAALMAASTLDRVSLAPTVIVLTYAPLIVALPVVAAEAAMFRSAAVVPDAAATVSVPVPLLASVRAMPLPVELTDGRQPGQPLAVDLVEELADGRHGRPDRDGGRRPGRRGDGERPAADAPPAVQARQRGGRGQPLLVQVRPRRSCRWPTCRPAPAPWPSRRRRPTATRCRRWRRPVGCRCRWP